MANSKNRKGSHPISAEASTSSEWYLKQRAGINRTTMAAEL